MLLELLGEVSGWAVAWVCFAAICAAAFVYLMTRWGGAGSIDPYDPLDPGDECGRKGRRAVRVVLAE